MKINSMLPVFFLLAAATTGPAAAGETELAVATAAGTDAATDASAPGRGDVSAKPGVRAEAGVPPVRVAGRRLSEAELDAVTAGDIAVSEGEDLLSFEGVRRTASGRRIGVDGSLEVIEVPTGITVGNLVLSDGAQQNLQSVININAVNSAVNVLLNLNVTIDSSVGDINQLNLTESLPAIPAGPPFGH